MVENYVTGANGFIGKHLAKRLYDQGNLVCIGHKLIHGYNFQPSKRFFFLSTYGNMSQHRDVEKMTTANVIDVLDVLNASDTEYLVFLSSSSVTLRVETLYALGKRTAESLIQSRDIPYCIIRPYSVIGVGEQKEHLIPTLIRSCMEGKEMPFVPDAIHDFIDVEDVVDAILFLTDNRKTGIFELGHGVPVTNQEVLELVQSVCQNYANVRTVDNLRPYDNSTWYCRKKIEGWQPKKSLLRSVNEMVDAYKHAH